MSISLQRLREARKMTLVNLSDELKIDLDAISTMEREVDLCISTLRSCIEAMGGKLKITVEFPEGAIQIEQFHDTAS